MNDNLFLQPQEVSQTLITIGEKKAKASLFELFVYGILAGIYIGLGAVVATSVLSGRTLDSGFARFLAGSVFSVGLMFVLIPGAELFTGNILMAIGLIDRKYPFLKLFRNWIIVYLGNFLGSLLLVWFVFKAGLLGDMAVSIAENKLSLSFMQAFSRGVLCNMLVCLAVIMCISSKTIIGKIFGIYFPIMAFVASGYEHSIANMYFLPAGLFVNGEFLVRFMDMFTKNLIPVTIGNIMGGLMIIFLHPKSGKKIIHFWLDRKKYKKI